MNLKEKFIEDSKKENIKVLVTLVQLPTGAIEIITNTENIKSKVEYIISTYNENFELNNNNNVKIVGYTLY